MKKNIRAFAQILLAVSLLLPVFASCGEVEYAVVSEGNVADGFTYTLYENGSAVITAGTPASDGTLVIPEKIDGHPVVGLAEGAFRDNTDFWYLKIAGSGVTVGKNCFNQCSALTVADISGVSEIGNSAFYLCTNLTYVQGCDNVASVGITAFCGCTSLSSVSFGKKLTAIGEAAFQGCSSLAVIRLPSSLDTLGNDAFSDCTSLGYADISSLKAVPEGCFCKCESLSRVIFSSGLTQIGTVAFRGCASLCTLTLPKSLKTVGDYAFAGCENLQTVNYAGSESAWSGIETGSGNETLLGIRPYCKYAEPSRKKTGYKAAAARGAAEGQYTRDGYTYALYEDGSAQITAYEGAGAILTIPESLDGHRVVSVGEAAFAERKALSALTVPDSVEEIGDAAFYDCAALSSVSGGKNLKHVGNLAFSGTAWLANHKDTYVALGAVLVAYRGTDRAVVIPDGIGYIGDGVFTNNTEITSADLGGSVVCVGNQAFAYCENLTAVTGTGVEHIGEYAFVACEKLSAADGLSPKTVGAYAFGDCNVLRYIDLGDRLETLSEYAFYSCVNLRALYLPDTLPTLKASCFSDCVGFVLMYPGSREQYLSILVGEGSLNLSDLFLLTDWKKP